MFVDRKDELESDYYKAHCLKLNCEEKGYKGEDFSFPKLILNDNAYIKFEGICYPLRE